MPADGTARGFEGEVLILLVRFSIRPRFLAAVHHVRSPAGPSVELVAGELGLPLSRRRGLRQTTLAVAGGLAPADGEPAALKWWSEGSRREVVWEEHDLRIRAQVSRAGIPVSVRSRILHPGRAGEEGAPARLPVRLQRARVEVDVPRHDPLGWLAGRCPGVLVSTTGRPGLALRAFPSARALRAPAVPEPG